MYLPLNCIKLSVSVNQSNIRILTRRITRLTQTQAGFTEELGVGRIRITNENVNLEIAMSVVPCIKRVTVVLTGGFLVSHRWNAKQSSYRFFLEGRSYVLEYEGCDRIQACR